MVFVQTVQIKQKKKMNNQKKFFRYFQVAALITGYLGSGKTTLLNNLLRQEKHRDALIVNDMGSINVDAEILKKNGSNVTERPMFELQNGCICCTLREEFIQQIEKISNLDTVDIVFVEASGISDPDAVNASFLSYEEDNPKTKVYLTSVVTVVDLDRIEFCNFIVLNKSDILNADQPKEVEAIIRDSQPRAPIFHSVNGNIDILDCRSGRKTESGIPRIQSRRKRSLGRGIRRQGKSAGNHRKGI